MGITPFLPIGSADTGSVLTALTITAAVVLLLVLIVRTVVCVLDNNHPRSEYVLLGIATGLGIAFAVLAFFDVLTLASYGSVISILGTLIMGGITLVVILRMFDSVGRPLTSRLWVIIAAFVAFLLYVCILCYTITDIMNTGGATGSLVWWKIYEFILDAINYIVVFLTVHAVVSLIVVGVMRLFKKKP